MFRSIPVLAVALALAASASAQRPGHGFPGRPVSPVIRGPLQPAGVIQPPVVPFLGSNAVPSPTPPIRPLPRRPLVVNPFFSPWGFGPTFWPWPDVYDVPSSFAATPPAPQFAPSPVFVTPSPKIVVQDSPPPSPRARLTLGVPTGAQVWVGGEQVDTRVSPIVLESPEMEPGQRYNFDLRVTWQEPSGEQERRRTVTAEAGQSTSLTIAATGR